MDLFTSLLGGKQNLPPKLPEAPPSVDTDATKPAEDTKERPVSPGGVAMDAFGNLQTVDEFLAKNNSSTPGVPKPQPKLRPYIQPSGNKNTSSADAQSDTIKPDDQSVTSDKYELDPHMGEESPADTGFCPFLAIAKFPYKFAPAKYLQPIATAYFDSNQIYAREWDYFYAYHEGKVIPFVPQIQVETLLAQINKDFQTSFHFAPALVADGLLINFTDINASLRPRFLGHANTRDQYDYLVDNAPAEPDLDDMFPPADRSLAAFKDHMENAAYISKAKSKAKRQQRQGEVVAKRQEMTKQILRAQRYLGLSAKKDETRLMPDIAGLSLTPLDTKKSAPYTRDMDAIFIAIDVEASERNRNTITEVGVATLDTRDLVNVAPGTNGKDWQPLIRARHLRVEENKNIVNHEFVNGCPDRFEFASQSPAGGSEFIPLKQMASALTSCFHAPFSVSLTASAEPETEKRNLILIGHDTNADISYCHSLGFSVLNRGNLLETLDTAAMYRSYTRDTNARSLGNVINAFDLTGWNLHNAGNDAVYTVWAMLAICVQEAAERGRDDEKAKREQREEERKNQLVVAAEKRAKEEGEGWDRGGDEDGGVPVPPQEPAPKGKGAKGGGYYTMGGTVLDV